MRTIVSACVALALGLVVGLILVAPVDAATKLRKPKRGLQARVGEYTIQPGQDLEVCEYRRLPNKKPMDVVGFKLRMPVGAHHFAIWTYGGTDQDDGTFPQGPVPSIGCTGVRSDDPYPQLLVPTQSPNTTLEFPEGIAFQIDANEQVWLNPHMKNFGDAPTQPDIRFNFVKAKKGSVKRYAEALSIGNITDIKIPPLGNQTLHVEWPAPFDMTVIHLATHQHRLGTFASIDVVAPDGLSRQTVVETTDWQHPTSVWPVGGIKVVQGQKLRINCTWDNTDAQEVRFGPKTTDEMCFIIGFFVREPANGTPAPGEGCLPSAKGLLCPLARAVPN